MRILIIGFQRSGTTLLRRLIVSHPDVKVVMHEKRLLRKKNVNKKGFIKSFVEKQYIAKKEVDRYTGEDPVNDIWGEKIPWNSDSGSEIIEYANMWRNKFGSKSRIVHIVRHPMDVALSNKKRGMIPLSAAINACKRSVPIVHNALNKDDYLVITYEELVSNPKKILKEIFEFCELKKDEKILNELSNLRKDRLRYFDGINKNRAFAYRKVENLSVKVPDYNKILKIIGRKV
jgi:hypothetical protein